MSPLDVVVHPEVAEGAGSRPLNVTDWVSQLTGDQLVELLEALGDRVGDVSATPAANTVQARLKQIADGLSTVGLNVDEVEGKLDIEIARLVEIRDYLDTVETKLAALVTAFDDVSTKAGQDTQSARLVEILAAVDGLEGLAGGVETALGLIQTAIADAEAARDADASTLQARADLLATEAKQDTLIGHVDGVEAALGSLGAKLDTIHSDVDGLELEVGDVELNTDQLEGKLDALHTDALNLQAELSQKLEAGDIAGLATQATLATRASEATLASVLAAVADLDANTDGLEAALATLNGKDFATQTTLAAVLAAVDGLETNTTGLATQTTLAALLAKIIAAPSTEAKQDDATAVLDAIAAALAGELEVKNDAGNPLRTLPHNALIQVAHDAIQARKVDDTTVFTFKNDGATVATVELTEITADDFDVVLT